ncbi:MAG: alpha/beta hydrolase [Chloroflexi bacterium RBG_16_54_11]|nr:MAG: alpha/beta hydrolase [Chloroflexi bacterium RBG_16_54_11]
MDTLNMEHLTLPTNGIRLHVVQAGSRYGSPVILLHGFPEFWYGWRKQIKLLAEAGLRVWVPDQRGYNLSDKPLGIAAYNIEELARDVIGLIDAAGVEKCYLAGHDWGAAVAWWVASRYPDRLHKVAILNTPHPAVMMQTLSTNPAQLKKSWYMFFFQIPALPEAILRNNDWDLMVKMLTSTSNPGSFTQADVDQYRHAWWRKGAATSMLNWYRAAVRMPPDLNLDLRIRVPALILWGDQDIALETEMAYASRDLCNQGKLVIFEGAGHWIQHDEAEAVNKHLVDFFSSPT